MNKSIRITSLFAAAVALSAAAIAQPAPAPAMPTQAWVCNTFQGIEFDATNNENVKYVLQPAAMLVCKKYTGLEFVPQPGTVILFDEPK